jgi:hypothetical protein
MQLIWPNQGLSRVLTRMLGDVSAGDLLWILYVNDVTPTHTTVRTDLTPDVTNFTEVSQSNSDFTLSFLDSAARTYYKMAPYIYFQNTGLSTVNVYGYFIVDPVNPELIAAARFDGAPLGIIPGDSIPVQPIIGCLSQA